MRSASTRPSCFLPMGALAACLALTLLVSGPVVAATYYVDFDGGSDAADGQSPQAAFKHSPGDAHATDKAKAAALAPGDKVIFKGGVLYRGAINVTASGAEGQPIVYDGNTAGTFGQGRAIIDGSEPLGGWQRCASAEDCGGNPNWKNIYYTAAPEGVDVFTCNLTQGDASLAIAQDPNPEDPFFEDVVTSWQLVVAPQPETQTAFEVAPGKGMAENSSRRFVLAFDGSERSSAILDPCAGSELTIRLKEAATATSVAVAAVPRNYVEPKDVVFLADGKEVLKATLDAKAGLQKFELKEPATFRELTLKILSAHGDKPGYAAIAEVQAYDKNGRNVVLNPPQTVYRDAEYFKQTDPNFWDGAYFAIHGRPNVIYYQKMLSFDPAEDKVTFEMLSAGQYPVGGNPPGRFSMLNCLGVLDAPGEFVLQETPRPDGSRRLYVWPLDEATGPEGIGVARQSYGFTVRGSHVTVQGFRIQKQGGKSNAYGVTGGGKGTSGITICDNEVTLIRAARNQVVSLGDTAGCLIAENNIHHNRRAGAIHLTRCDDGIIRGNRLHKNGATGLSLYTCNRVKVERNVVSDHKGMHANGLTAYLDCKDIEFVGNHVWGGNVGLTVQEGENFIIRNNIFDGGDSQMCVGVWNTDNLKNVKFLNNTFVRASSDVDWSAAIYFGGKNENAIGYVIKNNVLDGTSASKKCIPAERSHNIYTQRRWCEQAEQKWEPGPGEIVIEDLTELFVDPAKGDWRPKPGGPLIDAGADVGVKDDAAGAAVPQGKAPDIGAYEQAAP